ncbi:MAG: hypothetical protein AAF467_27485 [Actinomycetota bacterium]
MTSQFDFSNDEWEHVAMTPVLVGMAVAKAEDSGFLGSLRETRTLVASIAPQDDGNAAQGLIDQAAATDTKDKYDAFKSGSPDVLAEAAVTACRELKTILAAVATPEEAADFARWVIDVAQSVAEAAKEGGVRISAGEAALINELRATLGVDPSA